MKKIISAVTSAALAVSCLAAAGMSTVTAAGGDYIFHDSFDSSEGNWSGRGAASVAVSSSVSYEGNGSLAVTGRTAEWNGASLALSTSEFVPGQAYSFSVNAMQSAGKQKNVTLCLKLQYNDGTETKYDPIAEATTLRGEWIQLANTEYTIPAGASDLSIYVETPSGSSDFFIDEAIAAPAGTVIDGPGPRVIQLGDINMDGKYNIADLVLLKNILLEGNPTENQAVVADVNADGTINAADLTYVIKYLIGEITEFPDVPEPPAPEEPEDNFQYIKNMQLKDYPNNYTQNCEQQGKIVKEYYNCFRNGKQTYANVYLPYGYDESQKYNILYLMHGGGENQDTLFSEEYKFHKILDHMIMNGDMPPMIVVTPTFNCGEAQNFYEEYVKDLMPLIEGKYSTYAASTSAEDLKASRYHRAFGGFSMGSVCTWNVFLNCLDYTAYYMPLSGDCWTGSSADEKASNIVNAIKKGGYSPDEYFIFCATGSDDIAYPNMLPQIEAMKKYTNELIYTSDLSEGNFYFMVAPGKTHWWGYVLHYVYDILPSFFHEHQGMN